MEKSSSLSAMNTNEIDFLRCPIKTAAFLKLNIDNPEQLSIILCAGFANLERDWKKYCVEYRTFQEYVESLNE